MKPGARPPRSTARLVLLALMLAAVLAAAYVHRSLVGQATRLMVHAEGAWLLGAAGAIAAVYLCRAAVYSIAFRLLGYSARLGFLWSTAVVATSINQLAPIGGATGYAYLSYAFSARGVAPGAASLIALVDVLSYALSAATLVAAGLLYLLAGGRLGLGRLELAVAPGLLLVAGAAYLYHLQRQRLRLTRALLWCKNHLAAAVRLRWPDEPIRTFLDEYYAAKALLARRWRGATAMLGLQYLVIGCDFLALYCTLLSLHTAPPVWVVFMALILAMAGLSLVAVPAGGGTFEVILSTFLIAHGIPAASSIAAAVLYRVAAFWLPVVVSLPLLLRSRDGRSPAVTFTREEAVARR